MRYIDKEMVEIVTLTYLWYVETYIYKENTKRKERLRDKDMEIYQKIERKKYIYYIDR